MSLYLITLIGAVGLALCAERLQFSDGSLSDSQTHTGLNKFWVVLLIIFLVIISGFRYQNYFLSDEYNYRMGVISSMGQAFDWSQIALDEEWLFYVLTWVCANVFKNDQALIFIAALVTNTLIVCFFAKYAKPFWFVIFLYISSGAFSASMNILRQYIAVAILLWCYPLAQKRKFLPYLILVVIASFFHQSAWLMLPVYFVLRRRQFDLWTIAIAGIALLVFANFEEVMSSVLPNTEYDHYLDDITEGGYGVGLIRVATWLVPYVIILLFHKRFNDHFRTQYDTLYAVLLAACISVVSLQYVFVARIDAYFTLITYLAIIKIPDLFDEKGKRLMLCAMVLLFFIFGAYQYSIGSEYYNILFDEVSGVL